jgi:threonylcarbamoyladenosine tRNA methylthiotransferase MtaB
VSGAEVISMGCRLNLAESNALVQQLDDASDLIVINSCAVTNEAVRQTRQAIRQAYKRRPGARIIVTGCAAQVDPESFAAMPEVESVLGNAEKQDPGLFLERHRNSKILVSDIMVVSENAPHMVAAFSGKTRAFVEVQNGCDHRCTFCIIPFGRGNSRSVPAGQIVDHIKKLVDEGFPEIVLTGVDVTSYGHDLPGKADLGQLVERILRYVPDLPRLRLSSVDGVEIDARLFELLTGDSRVMPHVHLSLQSGDNMILKRMKRRHSRELAAELVWRLQAARPEITIGADIIAGFPTEDDGMFQNSLSLIDDCNIVHGHIFPYSAKTGTAAYRMPQNDAATIKSRARLLREKVAEKKAEWLVGQVGKLHRVAVEKGGLSGHAENFAHVELDRRASEGSVVSAIATSVRADRLLCRIGS